MSNDPRQHPEHIQRARELRAERPEVEGLLWSKLRGNQTGFKFRRQHPIGNFIADFACLSEKLVIELDGQSHDGRHEYDAEREEVLKRNGWRVLRFWNVDVMKNLDDVVSEIIRFLTDNPLT